MDYSKTMLSPLEAYLVSEVIDECLSQMKIIGQLSEFGQDHRKEQVNITSNESQQSQNEEEDDFLYSVKELTPEEKLSMDRKCIETVLSDTLSELKTNRTYNVFTKFSKEYKNKQRDYEEFHKRALEEQQMLPKMRKDVADAKKQMQKEVDDMDNYINELNFELQKMKARTEMEKSYVKNTCENEVEQVQKRCSRDEEEMKMKIECLKHRLSHEAEVNEEITKYWNVNEEELADTLSYWKWKFFDDFYLKEKELTTLKQYKALNVGKIALVSRKLKEARDFLENDRKEKQREKDRQEEERQLICAVTSVQAWWRGTMVRNKLGPYAVKKKGKKGKGKGKGKKVKKK